MNVEEKHIRRKFIARDYQDRILDAWINEGYRKILYVLPRRSGKDYLAWNMAIEQCLTKTCLVLYALPTYSQARKCVWDAIAIDGTKFIELIPPTLVANLNQSEMKVTFTNGSILRLIGADAYDTSLVGTNAQMIVLSEAALMQLEKVYAYARPILAANGGTIIVFGTPRGKNAFWHLFQTAQTLDDWFVLKLGTSETRHISDEVLEAERQQCSEDIFQQEWECSFSKGVEGQIYGRELDRARLEQRVGFFPHQPQLLTHLAIDIGVADATTIIWFQVPNENGAITIIDSYSNTNMGIDHYAKIMQDKPYRMGKYFAPHDLSVREWGGGAITRYEKARQLGVDFEILDQIDVQDGIDNVKLNWPRIHINESKCKTFLDALENYKREYDDERGVYKPKPVHNWASNYCDALRYLCMSLHRTQIGMSSEEFDRKRAQALYGNRNDLPGVFKHDSRFDRSIY
jgi:phage terminase large subunit